MAAPEATPLTDALHALNNAAYLAASEARKVADARAFKLKRIALETDDLVDNIVLPDPKGVA